MICRRTSSWARLRRAGVAAAPLLGCALFAGALLASGAARAEDLESDAVYVPAATARSLAIRNPLGTVSVQGWDRSEVRVIAHKRASSTLLLSRLRVRVDFGDGGVRITTGFHYSDDTFNSLPLAGAGIDLVVEAPRAVALAVSTFHGDVDASGFRAGAKLSSQEGHIRVADIVGLVDTRALDGDQWFADISGSLFASGVVGDVDLADVRGDQIDATVFRGRITARNLDARLVKLHTTVGTVVFIGPLRDGGRYDLAARDGDVRLMLKEAPFELSARGAAVQSAITLSPTGQPQGFRHVSLTRPPALSPARIDVASLHGRVALAPLP
jgi:hypothetical protein